MFELGGLTRVFLVPCSVLENVADPHNAVRTRVAQACDVLG